MKTTMEEKITVVKLPINSSHYICLKCQKDIEIDWKFCPECGIELNAGLQ